MTSTHQLPRTGPFGPRPHADHPAVLAAVVVLAGGMLATALRWHGTDLAAQVFRVGLVRRFGLLTWNPMWFGGHHTPGYSVLFPLLGAAVGVTAAGLVAAVVAAACFAALLRGLPATNPSVPSWARSLAAVWFAVGMVANLVVGRLPFALGLALGLAALLAAANRHTATALVLTLVCPLASPVAGVFLAMAWVAWAIAERRAVGLVPAAVAAVPLATVALLFPQGGHFPFGPGVLVGTLAASAAIVLLVPPVHRVLRVGAVLYALGCLATFAVPNPLGANVARLAALVAGPLLLATMTERRRLLVVLVPAMVFWGCSPALDGIRTGPADPSADAAYHAPLVAAVLDRAGADDRIEVVPTKHHWETAHVAATLEIARGWERQLDRGYNPQLYEPTLDAATYHAWLLDNGVRFVALADVAPDHFAEPEAALVAGGLLYLRPVWANEHWHLWEVTGSGSLLDGPAKLVAETPESVTLVRTGPGTIVLKVRSSPRWRLEGDGCLAETADGWLELRGTTSGRLTLSQGLVGGGPWCETPTG